MLRAGSGIIIVIAALHAVSALAQNERSDDQRSVVSRPQVKSTNWPEEGWCQSDPDKLTAMGMSEVLCKRFL